MGGCVNSTIQNTFVTPVAYHFGLNLPRAFSQPGKHSFGDLCILYGSGRSDLDETTMVAFASSAAPSQSST